MFELPHTRAHVTEHRVVAKTCGCGHTTTAQFPAEVSAPAVYGPRLRALAVYLRDGHHVPVARTARILSEALAVPVSTGWVASLQGRAAGVLDEEFIPGLTEQVRSSEVVHFDETGARVAGGLAWVHTAVTDTLTSYHLDAKRGMIGMDAHGILPGFAGVAVHDGFASYRQYDRPEHGLCAAHLLRELTALEQTGQQAWARDMAALLVQIHRQVQTVTDTGGYVLDPEVLTGFIDRYAMIVATGQAANPPPPRTGKRGRPALGSAGSLLKRLRDFHEDVLRFATDLRVPFDNNAAERAIRMVKVQLKISGTWRTWAGAEHFLTIRSYLDTARKHGASAFEVLSDLFHGRAWALPAPA